MTIPTKILADFLRRAKVIKTESIIPIYAFIRLIVEDGEITLIKANGHSFIRHSEEFYGEDIDVLLDELPLSIMCDKNSEDTVTLTVSEDTVTLKSGTAKQHFKTEPVTNFPKLPKTSFSGGVYLNERILSSIGAAASCTVVAPKTNFSFVYTNAKGVFSTTGTTFYMLLEENAPVLILPPSCCSLLATLKDAQVSISDNFYVFNAGGTEYGFLSEQQSEPPFSKVLDNIKLTDGINIPKSSLVDFLSKANKLSMGGLDAVKIYTSDNGLCFEIDNHAASMGLKTTILETDIQIPENVLVSARQCLQVISALSYEILTCYFHELNGGLCLTLKGEENHYSLIRCLKKL